MYATGAVKKNGFHVKHGVASSAAETHHLEVPRVAIMLSGGLDSTVLVHVAIAEGRAPLAVSIYYGQPPEELERARALARRRDLEHLELDAPRLHRWADGERPSSRTAVIAHRNALLIALAAHHVAGLDVAELWIGACRTDAAAFADCRPEWLETMRRLLELDGGPRLVARLLELEKPAIWELARQLGPDALDDARASWSCYSPRRVASGKRVPCRECGACIARAVGIAHGDP